MFPVPVTCVRLICPNYMLYCRLQSALIGNQRLKRRIVLMQQKEEGMAEVYIISNT
jgi:hypothetical protein